MEKTITLNKNVRKENLFLIWDHQKYFQQYFQAIAENIFNLIDHDVVPHVFLLGININNRSEKSTQTCLEPIDCGYSVELFSGLIDLENEFEGRDNKINMFAQTDRSFKGIGRGNDYTYVKAIESILQKERRNKEKQKFVSYPAYINGYAVFVILEVEEGALYDQYSLKGERYISNPSFVKSCIYIYLKSCLGFLSNPNNTSDILEKYPEEIMREAGKLFMYTISQSGNSFNSTYGFYEACNVISSLKYEGTEGLGKLVIAEKNHPNIAITLKLEKPIRIEDFRMVRKFLEMSDDASLIISDATFIYGLGNLKGKYNPKKESLFMVHFVKQFHWEVLHDNKALMIVEFKQPNLPKERINKEMFYSDFKNTFTNIDNSQIDYLWNISCEATRQKKGTILVITDNAISEARRLGKQSFPINPIKLTTEIIHQITSIDGSVLIDRNAICYAIGVILDGLATDKGDASRGSRYNSAVRYHEHFGKISPTILVIISEDGMINLIPDVKYQPTQAIPKYETIA